MNLDLDRIWSLATARIAATGEPVEVAFATVCDQYLRLERDMASPGGASVDMGDRIVTVHIHGSDVRVSSNGKLPPG